LTKQMFIYSNHVFIINTNHLFIIYTHGISKVHLFVCQALETRSRVFSQACFLLGQGLEASLCLLTQCNPGSVKG